MASIQGRRSGALRPWRLDGFSFAFAEADVSIIVDLPDSVSATAMSFAGNVSGTLSIRTVVLLTFEEVEEAVAMTLDVRPPGVPVP